MQRLHDEQGLGALIITHYQRILHYVKPEFVHILMDGRIVLQGGVELVERLEREGYDQIRQEVGAGPRRRATASSVARVQSTPRSLRPCIACLSDISVSAKAGDDVTEVQVKPGRHREATLYHALHGAGAGHGPTHASAAARGRARAFYTSELPVWRRSGFWTTSLQTSISTRWRRRLRGSSRMSCPRS